ncbi:spermatogenesis-associated protein 25 [Hemicordylus capensis]|uniref:spermatogenesis-associated protein 25 n=1 Tax=Hemicordylus capensis TaxID=884348 RepID=UPI002302688B|nr:spermatogenesis-associated protein 25 [Hemicordylus capensis]
MSYYGMGKASAGFFPPASQGEAISREGHRAPSSLASLYPGMPREVSAAAAAASLSSAARVFRRNLQAKAAAPLQLLHTQPCEGACRAPSAPSSQGAAARWEPQRSLPPRNLAQEYPLEQTKDRWPCLSPPLSQPPRDPASPRGDFALARWGFLPSGVFLMSAKLGQERGAPPGLPLPPNICILTLAMMIAGIPTVPVPGVREEDMIQAAQCFMAENLEPGGAQGEGAPRRSWAAVPRLGGAPGKRDRLQRKRAAHRSLAPLFLAQLEK